MATVGKPAIPTPRLAGGVLDQRTLQQAIGNIRERIETIERQNVAGQQAGLDEAISRVESQIAALRQSVSTLAGQIEAAIALAASFESVGNGVLVKQGELVVSRSIVPGFGIDVQHQDGQEGDPIVIWRPDPQPDVTELTISGHAPEVRMGLMVDVPAGALTVTGAEPAVA